MDRYATLAGHFPCGHARLIDSLRLALGHKRDGSLLVVDLLALNWKLGLVLPDLLFDTGEIIESL